MRTHIARCFRAGDVDLCIALVTAPSSEVADELARTLVEERLVACVNVLPGVRSFYRWQGRIECGDEVLLVLKTRSDRVDALRSRVASLHPYEVPEFVVLPIVAGLESYLGWVSAEVEPVDSSTSKE